MNNQLSHSQLTHVSWLDWNQAVAGGLLVTLAMCEVEGVIVTDIADYSMIVVEM